MRRAAIGVRRSTLDAHAGCCTRIARRFPGDRDGAQITELLAKSILCAATLMALCALLVQRVPQPPAKHDRGAPPLRFNHANPGVQDRNQVDWFNSSVLEQFRRLLTAAGKQRNVASLPISIIFDFRRIFQTVC
jgi:hypothetical protein